MYSTCTIAGAYEPAGARRAHKLLTIVSLFIRCTMRCEIWASHLCCFRSSVVEHSRQSVECRGFESHLRQLIFLRKSDCFLCAVLLCLVVVCLTLFASFFLLIIFSSLIKHVHCSCAFVVRIHVHEGESWYHKRSVTPISVLKAGHVEHLPQCIFFIICGFQSLSLSLSF